MPIRIFNGCGSELSEADAEGWRYNHASTREFLQARIDGDKLTVETCIPARAKTVEQNWEYPFSILEKSPTTYAIILPGDDPLKFEFNKHVMTLKRFHEKVCPSYCDAVRGSSLLPGAVRALPKVLRRIPDHGHPGRPVRNPGGPLTKASPEVIRKWFKNRPFIINVYNSWCHPCFETELPAIAALLGRSGSDLPPVVLIRDDAAPDPRYPDERVGLADIELSLAEKGAHMFMRPPLRQWSRYENQRWWGWKPVLFSGARQLYPHAVGTPPGTPLTLYINERGVISGCHLGAMNEAEFLQFVKDSEKTPSAGE